MQANIPNQTPKLSPREQNYIKNVLLRRFLENAPSKVLEEVKHQHKRIDEAELNLRNVKFNANMAMLNILDS